MPVDPREFAPSWLPMVGQQTALRKIMGPPKPPPLNPDGTRPGPFDELIKQFKRPAPSTANGGEKDRGRKRQPAAVSSPSGKSSAKAEKRSEPREPREPRDPSAKPPPPPRKRAKKRSGRRR